VTDIAAAVVLYHTDQEALLRNVNSYLPWVKELFVVDNSIKENQGIADRLLKLQKNLSYIPNKHNVGIAAALNTACEQALQRGYKWLLTMDQDSFFAAEEIEKYLKIFREFFMDSTDLAVVAPVSGKENAYRSELYSEVVSVITSGSLINLDIWKQAGGFDEKLFIDEVDHEYCYKVKSAGYRVVLVNQVQLTHRLGVNVQKGYFGMLKKSDRIIHHPLRVYFMVRNYLYVRKKYRSVFPVEFRRRDKQLSVILKNNLFFSGKFAAVFANIIKGYIDFRRNKFHVSI
jgi:rhamnosyltransferase